MKKYFTELSEKIRSEIQNVDMEGCDISIEESLSMINFLNDNLSDLRTFFLSFRTLDIQNEILFFKEMKPEVLGFLLYFNKIHSIELKRPIGSNETQKEYYENELKSLTYFFEKHLDFYQYYRSKSTYLDEHYFVRGKFHPQLCADSVSFIRDPLFSTGYDYKIAKILCNYFPFYIIPSR